MPPKASQKIKAEQKAPATPEKSKSKPSTDMKTEAPPKTPSKTPSRTPKKASDTAVVFTSLAKPSSGPPVPIDVRRDGPNAQSGLVKGKTGIYSKLLKLEATNMFTVGSTIFFDEGEYKGCQAIILHPAKPFEFMNLTPEIRSRVYSFYFASKNIVGGAIVVDGKRTTNKEAYAKMYADGSKNRVALLAANKEIHKGASETLYALPIRCDNTSTLIDFLSQEVSLRQRVTNIEVKNYQKTSARNALHLLAEAKNLQSLRFEAGVFAEGDPMKAAKAFYSDAYKFLQAMAQAKADGGKAVDILRFAKGALTLKDNGKDDVKNWPADLVEEFKECLKGKMTQHLRAWACVCGSLVYGHICNEEMTIRQEQNLERDAWLHLGHGGAAMLAGIVAQ